MSLVLSVTLQGLPKIITNGSQGSWRSKWGNALKWKRAIRLELLRQRFTVSLSSARLVLTRHSATEPDFDGLVASFKPLIDGLVEAEVIPDDKRAVIGQPEYRWQKASPRKGFVTIEVWQSSSVKVSQVDAPSVGK